MNPSEYGGSDTTKTDGIQPAPHVLAPHERMRLMYKQEPEADREQVVPVGLDEASSQLGS